MTHLETSAAIERAIADSPVARNLLERVFDVMRAYGDFLEGQGLVWGDGDDLPQLKASALIATFNWGDGGSIEVKLKDGPQDRLYGDGIDPDAFAEDRDR
jgi:hypothetical protein